MDLLMICQARVPALNHFLQDVVAHRAYVSTSLRKEMRSTCSSRTASDVISALARQES